MEAAIINGQRTPISIAYFVSPHGYGHAARSAAVMEAVTKLNPFVRFDIFTTVSPWLFKESLSGRYRLHDCETDIGMIQHSPLSENMTATINRLNRFLPFDETELDSIAAQLDAEICRLVVCDISPLGLAVARKASLPSVLVENFTWDWIYEDYVSRFPEFQAHVHYLREVFRTAGFHIQATPVCRPSEDADLVTAPIGRPFYRQRETVRASLGIPREARAVLLTFGGIPHRLPMVRRLPVSDRLFFVIPGASESIQRRKNAVLLPHHSGFYHPDLIAASDAVIGKLGYSTIAEVYNAGRPFGFLPRDNFRESPLLEAFVREQMNGVRMQSEWFDDRRWEECLPALLDAPAYSPEKKDGARQAAEFILGLVDAYA